jgi:hypothetical protein
LGFGVYVAAFFLPACRQVAIPGGESPDVYRGYACAWVTLINTVNREIWHSNMFLAVLSGWINPLLLVYLIFLVSPKLRWPRRILAGIIVVFIVGTRVYFSLAHLVPLIGHDLWIAGILMILAGESMGKERTGSAAA